MSADQRFEIATLAGGCFWCLEAVYRELRGVERVVSGYTGGHVARPSYEQVCAGATGHAEAVQITYDPQVVSYKELLEVFFTIHDPTTLNRQGADLVEHPAEPGAGEAGQEGQERAQAASDNGFRV